MLKRLVTPQVLIMQISKYIFIASAIALGIFSVPALAAPQINTIQQGNMETHEMVVSGTNFDSFDGTIVSWDDFEQQPKSSSIYGLKPIAGTTWTTLYDYKGTGLIIDTARSISGNKSVLVDWSKDKTDPRGFGFAGQGPFSKLYITYWRYMTGDFVAATSNHKQFYLYGNKNGLPQGLSLIPGGDSTWGFHPNFDTGAITALNVNPNNYNSKTWTWQNTSNKFQRWEYYIELNNPYTVANGTIKVWLDGELGINNTAYRARNVDGQFVDFRLGHMTHGFESSAKAWFDDVYISTTQARIEICNANVYERCTIKQLQYVDPANWSNTKISFKLRNLSELKEHSAFLYIVDKNGVPSNPMALPKPLPPTPL